MLRKMKLIAVVAAMLLLMTGCNLKEKISESITEGIIEKATDGEVDVDIDGDDVSYSTEEGDVTISSDEDSFKMEGEDGSVVLSGGEYDWPEDQAAAYAPKLGKGTVNYILNSQASCMVTVIDVDMDVYKGYKEDVIAAGFTEGKLESSAEDMELYYAANADGIGLTVMFVPSQNSISVTVDASAKQ